MMDEQKNTNELSEAEWADIEDAISGMFDADKESATRLMEYAKALEAELAKRAEVDEVEGQSGRAFADMFVKLNEQCVALEAEVRRLQSDLELAARLHDGAIARNREYMAEALNKSQVVVQVGGEELPGPFDALDIERICNHWQEYGTDAVIQDIINGEGDLEEVYEVAIAMWHGYGLPEQPESTISTDLAARLEALEARVGAVEADELRLSTENGDYYEAMRTMESVSAVRIGGDWLHLMRRPRQQGYNHPEALEKFFPPGYCTECGEVHDSLCPRQGSGEGEERQSPWHCSKCGERIDSNSPPHYGHKNECEHAGIPF